MKNASVLLSIAAGLAAPAAWALDCAGFANSTDAEPAEYRQLCHGVFYHAPWLDSSAKLMGDQAAYAGQMTTVGNAEAIGLYRFTLGDFPGATRVGEAESTANMFGMDFNPALTRLYGAQALQFSSSFDNRLGVLDLQTGAYRQPVSIIGIDFRDRVTGLTIHPSKGTAWLSSSRVLTNNPSLIEARLWRLNIGTATAQLVGRLLPNEPDPVFIDIAVNCQGEMYGHNISDDSLYRIDPETAQATRIGGHGYPANFAQGMDFDNGDGSLYAWLYTGGGSNVFGRFDIDSGALAPLATDSPRGQWEGAIRTECPGLISLDQTALNGAWYAPYTSGQGFTLRYFADARMLFMPWFTFSRDDEQGENPSPEDLRWYSLQGPIDAGATEATLPIYQVTDGVFDAQPGLPPVSVGEAHIRFFSCTEGVLEYQFFPEHNGGVGGTTSLTRLLPLGEACVEADGSTTAAAATYEGGVTGHWYDPQTPGQGLEISRVAATDNDTGFLFATWFTFDPEGSEDTGPASQHWFTLQGQQVGDDGVIQTSIIQSRGGSFDNDPALVPLTMGTAKIRTVACDRLTLTYDFNDTEAAGEFRNLEGEIALHRIGACP